LLARVRRAGKGSNFKFYIIVEEELNISQIEEQHKKILEGAKVLIVDDRQEYRLQISNILFKWKCQAVALSSGEEAIQYLSYNKPDVAIVDICMPYMSGIELAQALKKTHPTLPLIALSSMELKRGREIFDCYMNKPVDQNSLFPAMLKCLTSDFGKLTSASGKLTSMEPSIVEAESDFRKKRYRRDLRILVVEDETNNGFMITEMLKHLGFSHKIKYVDNGKKCIDEVQRCINTDEAYDVVLMDIIMPVMDGIEAVKHLRQLHRRPYIIITSAVVQNSEKERCQQLGVDGYLTKPILKENLYVVLKPLILDP
jgi:CheY-like chemotaxis protein